ncbi:lysine exporter protein (LysE/YggA) [Pseudopedobacter saltans DSM 12145]|uniref:Lysine exporter protein (LysE/YggA) n=1 Tax=Pseudopedobacter saltans (strain ATCC 51119 / DSM 12145 / JCM 21818 / CCUG 39354 / LMG 10337 / NBRC 100064 / NCIMB 13643) TaxID=762903 RepID=F0SEG3_PSESL|nr:LysE family transporter [Pseudopedobacter saltans]ADY50828.1 lysine exporter protein (LysE/YggA) [Pseudopedobacter saltans DSM 12145]
MLLQNLIVAIVVNFIGYLPFGNINLTAIQISSNRGLKQALTFVTTFAIFEAFFTYILLQFAEWFADRKDLIHWLDWVLVVIFLILGMSAWRSGGNQNFKEKEKYSKRDSIRLGIVLGIFNPMQIPFWMIGGTYLISNGWVVADNLGLEVFAVGAAIGAFLALYLFARFALYIKEKFSLSSKAINKTVAVIFFILIFVQLGKIYFSAM